MKIITVTLSVITILLDYTSYAQEGVGIGTTNPQALLDVSGAIKVGGSNVGAADAGSIRWDGIHFQGYNGSTWIDLNGSATVPTSENDYVQFGGVSINLPTSWIPIAITSISEPGRYLLLWQFGLTQQNNSHARFRVLGASNSEFVNSVAGGIISRPVSSTSIVTVGSGGSTFTLQGRTVSGNNQVDIYSPGNLIKRAYIKLSDL